MRAKGAVGATWPYPTPSAARPRRADYAPLGGTLISPAGAAAAPLVVAPVFDRALEEDETVTVTLLPGPYTQGTPASGTLEITDYRLAVTWDGSGNSTWTQPDATSWSGATYETNGFATFAGAGQGTVTLSGTVTTGGVTVSSAAPHLRPATAIAATAVADLRRRADPQQPNTYIGTLPPRHASANDQNRLPFGAGKGDVTVDGTLSFEIKLESDRSTA